MGTSGQYLKRKINAYNFLQKCIFNHIVVATESDQVP